MRVLPLEAELHQVSVQLRYLEVLKHQERLNDIKKDTRGNFKGCRTLTKVKPYLEVKLKEAKSD